MKLTSEQEKIVVLNKGAYLIKAPPKSGKTEITTRRICRIIKKTPDENFLIVVVTFTNKATGAFTQRLNIHLDSDERTRVRINTFYTLCLDMLRRYGRFIGFASNTTVYESITERISALKQALLEEGHNINDDDLEKELQKISTHKKNLKFPNEIGEPKTAAIYQTYFQFLKASLACDFDDVLLLTFRLLSEHPRIAYHYKRIFRHIILDGFQDITKAQYEILRLISKHPKGSIMLIYDPNQVQKNKQWFSFFEEDYDDVETYELTKIFNTSKAIITNAYKLLDIKENISRENLAKGWFYTHSFKSEESEANGIILWIKWLFEQKTTESKNIQYNQSQYGENKNVGYDVESNQVDYSDICILARNYYNLRFVIQKLSAHKIPFVSFQLNPEELESIVGKFILFGLHIINNPTDRLLKEKFISLLKIKASLRDQKKSEKTFFTWLHQKLYHTEQNVFLLPFISFFIRYFNEKINLVDFIKINLSELKSLAEKKENMTMMHDHFLLSEMLKLFKKTFSQERRNIHSLLSTIFPNEEDLREKLGVRVLTIHAAKGLKFHSVAIMDLNEGSLPDYRAKTESTLQTERRLMYVAMTRAKRRLLLTRARSKEMFWGGKKETLPSRFLKEMNVSMPPAKMKE